MSFAFANRVISYLQKSPEEFTKADIIRFIKENGIKMVDFMYPAGDGRIKTLNFVINDEQYLDTILTYGERVDGSSLFPFIEAGRSDLYVLPRFRTAFVDPFAEIPTLTMLCAYFDRDGHRLESSPDFTLHKACKALKDEFGIDFHAMGELEYYVISNEDPAFPAENQHGYHESDPFAKYNAFRTECMLAIAQAGGRIKYAHSEVGNFTQDGKNYEQNEIEFLPVAAEDAADQITLAKWIIRTLAWKRGLDVTFAPKITVGKAGSGMHIHMKLSKDGTNITAQNGSLSDYSQRAIAGLMLLAPSITAFGNTAPVSYFRLVPHQEAPTNVCWGYSNRSALVRVPLGWTSKVDMCAKANPLEEQGCADGSFKQTFEMRSPDGSANAYLLLAALCVGIRLGLEMEDGLAEAQKSFVDVNIHKAENAAKLQSLKSLPDSCAASADCLEQQRAYYEALGVFDTRAINGTIANLRAYNDRTLRQDIEGDPAKVSELVQKFFHCG